MSHRGGEDDDYNYSDDSFVSEGADRPSRKHTVHRKTTAPRKDDTRGKGRGKGWSKARSSNQTTPRVDPVVQRVLSARKLRINELRNNMEDLVKQIEDLRDENKLLKKTQHRQEKALNRFEDSESDLPQIMQRHSNEVRTMRDQLRKTKEKYDRTDRYLRDAEDELDKVKSKAKKYKQLVDENELLERDELSTKIKKAEIDMEEKDVRIKDLERHVNNLTKNHRHELGIEMARNRDSRKHMEQLQEENERLEQNLKEKVKELDLRNIYSNRMLGSRMLPNSYSGTPMRNQSPTSPRRRAPSVHDLSSREKVRLYEERRREEERKQREQKEREDQEAREAEEAKMKQRWEQMELARQHQEEREVEEREDKERRQQEREERERKEREEKDRQEAEEWKMKLERERMKREAEERQQEEEERQRRDRERAEQERRAEEERKQLRMDEQLAEERHKKDLLLAKLRDIDDGKKAEKERDTFFLTSKADSDVGSTTSSRKSYQFTRPVENLHEGKWSHEDVTIPYLEKQKKRKEKEGENGSYQPSFGRRGEAKKSNDKKPGEVVFNSDFAKPPKPQEKKKDLMANLFGKDATTKANNNLNDDIFSSSTFDKKQTNPAKLSLFDDEPKQTTNRENSLSLFGGGSALLDDELSPNDSSKLLPRRQRHTTTTFQSRPAVTAVDNYDDDIEEVIL